MQDDRIHVIKVSLMHDKTIYRKIAIRGDQTLKDLHAVIVTKGESPPQYPDYDEEY